MKKAAEAASLSHLSDRAFFWTAVILQLAITTIALSFRSIVDVVNFIGAFSASYQVFLFPGLVYLKA